MTVKVIALNTFKEAVRDRILYLLLFFAAVSILFSRVLALLTVGDRAKIIKDVGLASISLFGALMAVLIGTGLVYKEIEKRTIFTLISKPIRRHEFLLGKFFGLLLTLLVMLAAMSLIFVALVFVETRAVEWRLFAAIFLVFFELALITAVAVLFSCFSTPILSSLFTISFYLIGHFSWSLDLLIKKARAGAAKASLRVLSAVLPNLENFNVRTEAVQGLPFPPGLFLYAPAYGIAYAAFVLVLAVLVFRRRDFV